MFTFAYPTDPFTTLMFQNPSHNFPGLHNISRFDFEALKLQKGQSGGKRSLTEFKYAIFWTS